jgi:hypothetical protein
LGTPESYLARTVMEEPGRRTTGTAVDDSGSEAEPQIDLSTSGDRHDQ